MRITDVDVRPVSTDPRRELLAYCTFRLDDELVVGDVTLINGRAGVPFLSFSSSTGRRPCLNPACRRACRQVHRYCPWCGARLSPFRPPYDRFEPTHPTNGGFRRYLTDAAVDAYLARGAVLPDRPPDPPAADGAGADGTGGRCDGPR